jgi:putative Mg2+ transporter-C (MgtC) family protein
VVTGIGFIGAGCIIQERQRVKGLTTAATIWVVAAIGIISGAGFPIVAFVSALMVTTTLVALRRFEKRFLESERGEPDESGESG